MIYPYNRIGGADGERCAGGGGVAADPPRLPRWAGGGCCGSTLCSYGIPGILGIPDILGIPGIPGIHGILGIL
jgi:hypothetical protein